MQSFDRSHGREEERRAQFFTLEGVQFARRWRTAGITTLIVVERSRTALATGDSSTKTAFYISNLPFADREVELFEAIRGHWSVEVYHHVRDVTFAEDSTRTVSRKQAHIFTLLVSTAIRLIQKLKPSNIRAALERFADVPHACRDALRQLRVL